VANNTAAAVETLFALFADGPLHNSGAGPGEHWKFAAGPLLGAPVVGGGSANAARVYVASNAKALTAIKPDGTLAWTVTGLANFTDTPAVASASRVGGIQNCEAVFAAGGGTVLYAACQDPLDSTQMTSTPVDLTEIVTDSPVTFAGGSVFVGTNKSIAQTSLGATTGLFASPVRFSPAGGGTFTGIVALPPSAPTALFAGSSANHSVYGVTFTPGSPGSFATVWNPSATDVASTIQGEPVLNSVGNLLLDTADAVLHGVNTTSGVTTPIATLSAAGYTPLLGADGKLYVTTNGAIQALTSGGATLWSLSVAGAVIAAPTLDCNGALYAAAGDTVYVLITDMMVDPTTAGLSNTNWPKFQRDSRNSGNADALTKWGMRTAPSVCAQ